MLAFICKRCNQCCNGQGGIRLDHEQLLAAAGLLNMPPLSFMEAYCRFNGNRWEVLSDEQGNCRLLSPAGCSIHAAKPPICRQWPFLPLLIKDQEAFLEAKTACPGFEPGATFADFLEQAKDNFA